MNYLPALILMLAFTTGFSQATTSQSLNLAAKPLTSDEINQVSARVMKAFDIPGVAVGVIYQGKIVHAKGYGLKEINTTNNVDTNTIFKIASNTKAFTTAALAMLVDEDKLNWQGHVVDYLPNFKLADDWLTQHFTVIDLLTHRSGLGLGAGDLMLWPEPSSFTRDEVVKNLRYLKIKGRFRASYAYDNLLYIVAGQLIPAITGMSWQDFVQTRIMQPLGMQHCFAGNVPDNQQNFLAKPHLMVNDQLTIVKRKSDKNKGSVSAAAGGIQCSLADMLLWANVFLQQGQYTDSKGNRQILFSKKQFDMLWQGQTIMPVSKRMARWDHTHFSEYALGWRKNDVNGFIRVHHTGSLSGMYSSVSFLPELDLGIIILTNQQSSNARNALMYAIMKSYLPLTMAQHSKDWVAEMLKYQHKKSTLNTSDKSSLVKKTVLLNTQQLNDYLGQYHDNWLGDFTVSAKPKKGKTQLIITSKRVVKFIGNMTAMSKDKFLVTWQDRTLEADVYAQFSRDKHGNIVMMKLIPVADDIDFSYDFQDLELIKE